jgi:hypothetical protein
MKKIPKEVKLDLEARATELPKLHYTGIKEQSSFSGLSVITAGIKNDKNGGKIDPNKRYLGDANNKEVNHYKKLRHIWFDCKTESEAWQKIAAYCAQVKHTFNTSNHE